MQVEFLDDQQQGHTASATSLSPAVSSSATTTTPTAPSELKAVTPAAVSTPAPQRCMSLSDRFELARKLSGEVHVDDIAQPGKSMLGSSLKRAALSPVETTAGKRIRLEAELSALRAGEPPVESVPVAELQRLRGIVTDAQQARDRYRGSDHQVGRGHLATNEPLAVLVDGLLTELNDLKQSKAATEHQRLTLSKSLTQLQNAKRDAETATLRELSALRARLREVDNDAETHRARAVQADKKLAAHLKEIEPLRKQLKEAETEAANMKKKALGQEQLASLLAKDLSDAKAVTVQLEEKHAREVSELKAQLQSKTSTLNTRVVELEAKVNAAERRVRTAADQLALANTRMATAVTERDNLVNSSQARIAALEGRLQATQQSANQYQAQLLQSYVQLKALQDANAQLHKAAQEAQTRAEAAIAASAKISSQQQQQLAAADASAVRLADCAVCRDRPVGASLDCGHVLCSDTRCHAMLSKMGEAEYKRLPAAQRKKYPDLRVCHICSSPVFKITKLFDLAEPS